MKILSLVYYLNQYIRQQYQSHTLYIALDFTCIRTQQCTIHFVYYVSTSQCIHSVNVQHIVHCIALYNVYMNILIYMVCIYRYELI